MAPTQMHTRDILREFAHIVVKEALKSIIRSGLERKKLYVEELSVGACHSLTFHVIRLESITDIQCGHA